MTLPELAQAETIWILYKSIYALSLYIVESGSATRFKFANLTRVRVAGGSS